MRPLFKNYFIKTKKSFIIVNLVAIFLLLVFSGTEDSSIGAYIIVAFIASMIIARFMLMDQCKKYYGRFLNSLPINREDEVLSKFIYFIIIYLVTSAILFCTMVLLKNHIIDNISYILFAQSIAWIIYLVIISILSYISYTKETEVINRYTSIIILAAIYVPVGLVTLLKKFFPNKINGVIEYVLSNIKSGYGITIFVFLMGLIIYNIVMMFTMRGYLKKDLD